MTAVLDLPTGEHTAVAALRAYLADVAAELGAGPESCTIDHDTPVSAYLAIDTTLPSHPGRDLALLWHEEHGWSAAIETHSGEDLIIIDHLVSRTVLPRPREVARFVGRLASPGHTPSRRTPPRARVATDHEDLAALFARATVPTATPVPDLPGR